MTRRLRVEIEVPDDHALDGGFRIDQSTRVLSVEDVTPETKRYTELVLRHDELNFGWSGPFMLAPDSRGFPSGWMHGWQVVSCTERVEEQ